MATRGDSVVQRWLRRLVTVPGLVVLAAIYLLLLPALIVVGLLVDGIGARRTMVRLSLALAYSFGLHLLALPLLAGAWIAGFLWPKRKAVWDRRLLSWLARQAFWAAARLFDMQLTLEGAEALDEGPYVLASRHVSILDTLLPWVVGAPRGAPHPRYVMKHQLLWDPIVDIAGHRAGTAFVRRYTRQHRPEIQLVAGLLEGLGPDECVAIFPEGTRFSPRKKARVLRSLARRHPEAVPRAERLKNLLPPRPGGFTALMEGGTDVIFCAHTGLEGAGRIDEFIGGTLLGSQVRVRYWRVPASEVPEGRQERIDWLGDWWERLDAWIEEQGPARAVNSPCGQPTEART